MDLPDFKELSPKQNQGPSTQEAKDASVRAASTGSCPDSTRIVVEMTREAEAQTK